MELLSMPHSTSGSFPFTEQEWEQTPPVVQAYLHIIHQEMSQLRERVEH
jgi:hypothetical protein